MSTRSPVSALGLAVLLLATACDAPPEPAPDGASEPRAPLGKADRAGSCVDGEEDFCGGQSIDRCWCDDLCESFGDCCSDYEATCEDTCEPASCADVPDACGEVDDGCGDVLDCGPCPEEETWWTPGEVIGGTLTCAAVGTVRVSTGTGCNSMSTFGEKPMGITLTFSEDAPELRFDAIESHSSAHAYWEPRRLEHLESQPILLAPIEDSDNLRGSIGAADRVVATASPDGVSIVATVAEFNFSTCSAFCGCNSFRATCSGQIDWP